MILTSPLSLQEGSHAELESDSEDTLPKVSVRLTKNDVSREECSSIWTAATVEVEDDKLLGQCDRLHLNIVLPSIITHGTRCQHCH